MSGPSGHGEMSASFGDDAEGMGSEGEYGIAEGQAGDEQ